MSPCMLRELLNKTVAAAGCFDQVKWEVDQHHHHEGPLLLLRWTRDNDSVTTISSNLSQEVRLSGHQLSVIELTRLINNARCCSSSQDRMLQGMDLLETFCLVGVGDDHCLRNKCIVHFIS